jgi:hypothetical protein
VTISLVLVALLSVGLLFYVLRHRSAASDRG